MATLSAPTGYTSSNLVFQESFNGTTLGSVWHPYITSKAANGWPWNDNGSGGSGVGGVYDADYNTAEQVAVSNGLLTLTAEKESIYGVNQGSWETFPITAGAVSSYGNFEFKGGYLQISMKAPSGDGAWPGLWLLPGKGATSTRDNFEIDVQEGGYTGSGPANQAFSWHLHTPSGTVGGVVNTGIDLTADFHTYGINWVPGQSITWYLDGKQIARVTSAQVTIPSEPMELILSHQVADSDAAGWHTALNSSTPQAMQMQVDEIQLYQLPNSGNTVTGANVTPGTTPTTPTPTTPTVTQVIASPGTGIEHAGDTITMTLGFSEAVTVTGTPTLKLNNGDTAAYVSGSGTSSLTFRTTVASTDADTSALAVTGVNLSTGTSIKSAAGTAANLSGAAKTFTGLQVNPILPAVTQVTASPATGVEHPGDTITLTLGFNEAVTVSGTPTLKLNDGGTATYVGGSGTGSLTFRTTVAATDISTSALAVTGVNLPNGASIKDALGVAANLSGATKTFSGLQIDPTVPTGPTTPTTPTTPTPPTPSVIAPTISIADDSLFVAGRGGTVDLGIKVTTSDPNDLVTLNIRGLPKYETISNNLNDDTDRGRSITLTAAEVNSGLTLHSYYRGSDSPVATLKVTATAKDPVTGAVATSAPKTITVVDPPPTTTTSATTAASTAHQGFALLSQYLAGGFDGARLDQGQIAAAFSKVSDALNNDLFLARPH